MTRGEQLVVQPQAPSPSDRGRDERWAAAVEGATRAASSCMPAAAPAVGPDAEWSGAGVMTDPALLGGAAIGGLAVTSLLRP
jgi:hypothetical protein